MKNYHYHAIDKQGKSVKASMQAVNEVDLEKKLKIINLELISLSLEKKSFSLFSEVSKKDLIILCIQLERLSKAGIELVDIIEDLRDSDDNSSLKNILAEIHNSLINGSIFSEALKKHPKVFNNIFIFLIEAGEKTGDLSQIFSYLANILKWSEEIKSKIKKASYYPIFLLLLMGCIIGLMMNYVIPQLSNFLLSQNFSLPIHTRLLISTSKFVQNYGFGFFLSSICIIIVIKFCYHVSTSFKMNIHRITLSLPLIGNIVKKIELAKFCRFFSIMFRSKIDILQCLDSISNIMSNLVFRNAVIEIRKSVSQGSSLTEAFTNTGKFPSLIIRMIKIGEKTNSLDSSLENVNYFYDREVDESVNRIISMIQPTLTIIMGILMLWITSAIFGPLYSSFSNIKF